MNETAPDDDTAPVESEGGGTCCEAELEAGAVEAIADIPEEQDSETVEISSERRCRRRHRLHSRNSRRRRQLWPPPFPLRTPSWWRRRP